MRNLIFLILLSFSLLFANTISSPDIIAKKYMEYLFNAKPEKSVLYMHPDVLEKNKKMIKQLYENEKNKGNRSLDIYKDLFHLSGEELYIEIFKKANKNNSHIFSNIFIETINKLENNNGSLVITLKITIIKGNGQPFSQYSKLILSKYKGEWKVVKSIK